jgi:hypothetical protein
VGAAGHGNGTRQPTCACLRPAAAPARYDKPQLTAIELAATHVARPPPAEGAPPEAAEVGGKRLLPFTLIQVGEASLQGPTLLSAPVTLSGKQAPADTPARAAAPPPPTTPAQGPPGTGKTHTVLGILNAWHLTQFQRYYIALEAWLVRQALAVRGAAPWGGRGAVAVALIAQGLCWGVAALSLTGLSAGIRGLRTV